MNNTNPIKTALCAFGMSGRIFHGPFLKINPGFSFDAVLERTKNETTKIYPDVRVYRNIEDLINDEEIELVIVNTPNATHYDFAKKALERGKHVVVEKPFTITSAEGLELIRIARLNSRVLTVYQNRRYDSDYRTIKKVLDNKWLGQLVEAGMYFDRFKLDPGNKIHKETPGPGTGNLYDLGSHIIDQTIQLFGMPDKLFADIDIVTPASRVDNYFELLLFYPELRVRIHSTYVALSPLPGYILHGTEGSFLKPRTNIQEEKLSIGELPEGDTWGREPEKEYGKLTRITNGIIHEQIIPSEKGNYMDFYHQLYAAIREGKPVPVDTLDATRVIHIIELAYESNRLKRVVEVKDIKDII